MKKNILFICAISFVLFSCGGSSQKQNVHTHEDGTTHEEHAPAAATTEQESFKVEADTTRVKKESNHESHEHGHEHGHDHSSESGHKH